MTNDIKNVCGVTNEALGKPMRSTKGSPEHSLKTPDLEYMFLSHILYCCDRAIDIYHGLR